VVVVTLEDDFRDTLWVELVVVVASVVEVTAVVFCVSEACTAICCKWKPVKTVAENRHAASHLFLADLLSLMNATSFLFWFLRILVWK
jgi:hypothetical protein